MSKRSYEMVLDSPEKSLKGGEGVCLQNQNQSLTAALLVHLNMQLVQTRSLLGRPAKHHGGPFELMSVCSDYGLTFKEGVSAGD